MRTNIDIDELLVKEVMKISKITTKNGVINYALEEVVKKNKRKLILGLRGKVKWEGNLDEMRTYDKWENKK